MKQKVKELITKLFDTKNSEAISEILSTIDIEFAGHMHEEEGKLDWDELEKDLFRALSNMKLAEFCEYYDKYITNAKKTYKLTAVGYDAPAFENIFATADEARAALKEAVTKYVDDHGSGECSDYDVDYDNVIMLGYDEKGAVVFRLYEVPEFKSKIEELLWQAKLEADNADSAAEDYKFALQDCCVDTYTYEVQRLIDEALKLM